MNSRTYQAVTQPQTQGLLDLAKSYNAVITGDLHQGTIDDFGSSIGYTYDATAQVLTLTVLQKPWCASDATVLDQIESHSGLKS